MYSKPLFWKVFTRRTAITFFVIIFLLFTCILRVAVISKADYSAVTKNQNCLRLKIQSGRGTIFDCNMIPLTNNKKKIIAAVSPTPKAVTAISSVLSGDTLKNILEQLRSGKPVLCEVPEKIECDGIVCTEVYTSEDTPAIHTVGYTDASDNGVTGLQKAYDQYLKSDNDIEILFECDGKGGILQGLYPTVNNDTSVRAGGIVTTLDYKIQSIAEETGKSLKNGAVVIADAKTAKLRAVASFPMFEKECIAESISDENSPMLNRTVNAYNVGSVFKPCVAAAAIENGFSGFSYTCLGGCQIADRFFKCHKLSGHGEMNLKSGLANSCNAYFYNLAFSVGGNSIYKMAESLKFGKSLKLCENFGTRAGNLPSPDSLQNIANLANFSIGQGELLLSPVSMLTLYCSIANDGCYISPSLVEGTVKNGTIEKYELPPPTRVMKMETAEVLKEYLKSVLTEGTGAAAIPKTVTAAGKTATAQTGKFKDGVEICQGWFCGFFPAESPEYVVIVFSEDTGQSQKSTAEVFSEIADSVSKTANKTTE